MSEKNFRKPTSTRLQQQLQHHGSKIHAHVSRLTKHVQTNQAVVEIFTYRLGKNGRRLKASIQTPDSESHIGQRNGFPHIGTADHGYLLAALDSLLFH